MPQDLLSHLALKTLADPRTAAQSLPTIQPAPAQQRTQFADQLKRRQEPEESQPVKPTTRSKPARETSDVASTPKPKRDRDVSSDVKQQREPTQLDRERQRTSAASKPQVKPSGDTAPVKEPETDESVHLAAAGQATQQPAEASPETEPAVTSVLQPELQQLDAAADEPGPLPDEQQQSEFDVQKTSEEAVVPSALRRHLGMRQETPAEAVASQAVSETEQADQAGPAAPSFLSRSFGLSGRPQAHAAAQPNGSSGAKAKPAEVVAGETTGETLAEAASPPADVVLNVKLNSVDSEAGQTDEGEANSSGSETPSGNGQAATGPNGVPGTSAGAGNVTPAFVESPTGADGKPAAQATPQATPAASGTEAATTVSSATPTTSENGPQRNQSESRSQTRVEPFAAPLDSSVKGVESKAGKAAPTPTLDVNKPGFAEKLNSFMHSAAETGKSLRIRLNPRELGMLQIEVQRVDGQTTAKLEVETPAARAIVLEQLHVLRDSLQQQGIRLDSLDVELNENLSQSPDEERQFGEEQQHSSHDESSDSPSEEHDSERHAVEPEVGPPRRPERRINEQIDVAI